MSGKAEALMRGLGQGFTGKWGDELIPLLTPDASDDTGIPRNYAAGSAYNDLRNNERAENQEAADKYPGNFYTGQALGALPSAVATGGMAGEGVAANALLAGARGGLEGAGGGTEGNRAMGAAWGAGPSAVLGGLGAGVAKAAPYIKDLFKNGPPGGPPLAPAMATVGGEAAPEASEIARGAAAARGAGSQSAAELGGPLINRAVSAPTVPPPARAGAAAKTQPPPRRAQQSMVDKELAGGRKLGPEETAMRTNALPPPKGYGGDFKVPKDTGLPNVPHIDFGNNVEIAGVTPNIKRGATDAPRMARLMGRTIPIEPPRPGIPTIPPSAISTEAKAIQAGEAAPFHDLGPPTVPPDAVSPAARSALAGERAPFMPADDVIAGHGPRTTPPGALNYEQSVGPMRERARNAMLPPSSDEALDNSMIMGGPQTPRIPTEYSGRMRPAVTNFERLPNETDKAMKARIAIQDAEDRAALHQAQGKPAGDHLRERPQRSGQSMFDADQLAGNPSPKTPSEYKRSERPTGGYHSEFPEGHPQHGNGKTGAFDYGEFKLSSAPGAKKKTDVKALMKKRADDEE